MTTKLLAAGALPLALAACSAATPLPDTSFVVAPAAPTVAARQTGYVNPIRNYTARPVVDPADWRQSNQSQEGL
ncbi:hypothetical protein [Palleronia abyssalis]|uniref:Uncharacterized protein n=1 Tax=Palleronia abyssalis TaxID=1501240 RepID=A0A2R8BQV2_9RHOB|nr:hypothetical protein [Palleronia abyssalis]SPJ22564.1 hypothetical protein PAA8504_00358 [Palleronia abyssalis]